LPTRVGNLGFQLVSNYFAYWVAAFTGRNIIAAMRASYMRDNQVSLILWSVADPTRPDPPTRRFVPFITCV